MKVLQVLYPGLGGHGSVALSLVAGDVEKTTRHALLFFGIEPTRSEYADRCAQLGASWRGVLKRPGPDARALAAAMSYLRDEAPDVLLVHSATFFPFALAYARATRRKVFAVEHQAVDARTRREWASTLLALRTADKTVLLTEEFRSALAARAGRWLDPARVAVVPNGINLDAFSPAARGDGPFTVTMQSRFTPLRDHGTLLRAFKACLDARSIPADARLVLAGDGGTMPDVAALVATLELGERVELPGMLDEPALRSLLHRSDVYAHATRMETMSTAVMQAMACGVATVGTDIPAMRSLIDDGVTGLRIAADSVEAMAQAIARLYGDAALRARLAAAGRAKAERDWSHRTMFTRYRALWEVAP